MYNSIYVSGKEKVFGAVAEACNTRIWIESSKKRIYKCLNHADISSRMADKPTEARLHVLSMNNLTPEVSNYNFC